jgi:mono/diheme cytochrome c family protein
MSKIFLSILFIALFTITYTLGYSDKALEGKEIYLEAKCSQCHFSGSKFITKATNKAQQAKDYKSLKGWISGCNGVFDAQWFDDEIELVANYLNETHYKFIK